MSLNALNQEIISCKKCERLVEFREKIAKEKRKSFLDQLISENLINSESYDRAINDDGNHTSILIRVKYLGLCARWQ